MIAAQRRPRRSPWQVLPLLAPLAGLACGLVAVWLLAMWLVSR